MSRGVKGSKNPMVAPKPIPTNYGRYTYKSRLEARWSVLLDALGVPFAYEAEGYQLGNTAYLCDFWLPRLESWVEIKPKPPTRSENRKALWLSVATGHPVYLFHGEIIAGGVWAYCYTNGDVDEEYFWCECPVCGELGIQYQGFANRLPCLSRGECREQVPAGRVRCTRTPRLVQAYRTATQMDFRRQTPSVDELPVRAPYQKFLGTLRSDAHIYAEQDFYEEAKAA